MGTFTTAMRLIVLSLLTSFLMLAGCTSGWRAPLDDRRAGSTPDRVHPAISRQPRKPPKPGAKSYRVQRGDTLYAIAWRSDHDFRELARWNGIRKPYTIYVGQKLRLQPPTRPVKPIAKSKPPAVPKTARVAKPVKPKTSPRKLGWRWPAAGRILATFHAGDPLRKGIKIGGKTGSDIRAAESGKVVYSGSGLIGYGRLIIVKHNDKYLSAYGHNRKLLVREGEQVAKGQKIAELGTANDGQAMLHFEIRRDGKPVNPVGLLPRR